MTIAGSPAVASLEISSNQINCAQRRMVSMETAWMPHDERRGIYWRT